ncbi:unnamed protein product [Anisakis simplex]|uniref:Glycosyltransferase n=1 Tax=Anisakis simplex TaxID=6269 RepID=A0A0M3J0S8_ANISI|nr:unnamed protein product [Anisakis simplex]
MNMENLTDEQLSHLIRVVALDLKLKAEIFEQIKILSANERFTFFDEPINAHNAPSECASSARNKISFAVFVPRKGGALERARRMLVSALEEFDTTTPFIHIDDALTEVQVSSRVHQRFIL